MYYTGDMPSFSFDIVSEYDKAEMNNVFDGTQREMANRYDFKGTPAAIDWLDDKRGFVITGANAWQCETVLDIVRKKLAARGLSSKSLDLSASPVESNLKATWEIPFKAGLDQDNAKRIAALLRTDVPKVKPSIQGDSVRVTSSSKDDLQTAISCVKAADLDVDVQFINYR